MNLLDGPIPECSVKILQRGTQEISGSEFLQSPTDDRAHNCKIVAAYLFLFISKFLVLNLSLSSQKKNLCLPRLLEAQIHLKRGDAAVVPIRML